MIGQIRGKLIQKQPPDVLIETQDGLGYEVTCSMTSIYQLPELGSDVVLQTHFVVREDAQILFGFCDQHERALFRALIKVNGVGPRLALAILSSLEPKQFAHCLAHNDAPALVKIPGVGKKTAERLIIEMRDKMDNWTPVENKIEVANKADATIEPSYHDPMQEASGALVALGYRPTDASRLLKKIYQPDLSCEALIRLALREVSV